MKHFYASLLLLFIFLQSRLTLYFFVCVEKIHGVHKLPSPTGDEEWKVCLGVQAVPEDDPSGESQAGYSGQQLPCS